VLLVGGKGSRLHPFTATFPKPLMPLGEKPILEVLLRRLIASGVTRVTLALGHLGELIQAYLAHRPALTDQLTIDYVWETSPLGTSGALSLVSGLDEPFLVMNGDVLTDFDFGRFIREHAKSGAALSIAAHRKKVPIDLGVLKVDGDRRLVDYVEKPVEEFLVSMGIYAYDPRVLDYVSPQTYLDFPDLVLKLLAAGEQVMTVPTDALWLDIGRPDDYAEAQRLFGERREELLDG
jgi:NDP-sugar pyrophosphorylase family protein